MDDLSLKLLSSNINLNQGQVDIHNINMDPLARQNHGNTNYSEEVRVPSSEHVAEIVGRQGCKIKQLRAKTNTYIKTPEKGMDSVFVITGRFEDVKSAKKQIIEAARHFTNIRASRRSNGVSGPMPDVPGQVTHKVRVPMHLVGLVVGSKGATIKRIQQETQTHIMTPSREKDPVFEVTGLPENVMIAEKKMRDHINSKTGIENEEDPFKFAASLDMFGNNPNSADLGLKTNPMSTGFWRFSCPDGGINDITQTMALLNMKYQNNELYSSYNGGGSNGESLASSHGTSQPPSNYGSSESSPTVNQSLSGYF